VEVHVELAKCLHFRSRLFQTREGSSLHNTDKLIMSKLERQRKQEVLRSNLAGGMNALASPSEATDASPTRFHATKSTPFRIKTNPCLNISEQSYPSNLPVSQRRHVESGNCTNASKNKNVCRDDVHFVTSRRKCRLQTGCVCTEVCDCPTSARLYIG
jgi:hypothetical protein